MLKSNKKSEFVSPLPENDALVEALDITLSTMY
jgi:hypothetical protein